MEFKVYLANFDIKHTTSSLIYPQSNALIERMIQKVKGLILKTTETLRSIPTAIMSYNATSKSDQPSPTELLMDRKIKPDILVTKAILTPKYEVTQAHLNTKKKQMKQKEYYDRHTEDLEELIPGPDILIQQGIRKWSPGKIVERSPEPSCRMNMAQITEEIEHTFGLSTYPKQKEKKVHHHLVI